MEETEAFDLAQVCGARSDIIAALRATAYYNDVSVPVKGLPSYSMALAHAI